jgi:hypothetical protein
MRDVLTSPKVLEIKKKRNSYRKRLSILFFILFICIFGALAYFSPNRKITINKIDISGTNIINEQDVNDLALKDLSGRYLHLFYRANSFIYPHDKIYKDLLYQFPRIETLKVSIDKVNTLKIAITERAGNYLYCGESIPEVKSEIGENCFFVNNDGYIFDKAPYFSGNVYFKYYIAMNKDENNNLWPMSAQMLKVDDFHKLASFIDKVKVIGFKPVYIVLNKDNEYVLHLDNKDIDSKIIFNNNSNFDDVFENLSIAMKKPEFAQQINSKYDSLLYIDLRFKNKVVYKFSSTSGVESN